MYSPASRLPSRFWLSLLFCWFCSPVFAQYREFRGESMHALAISADSKTLAAGGLNVRFFDLKTGILKGTVKTAGAWILAYSPDGKMILTGGASHAGIERPVRFWKLATGTEAIETQEHGSFVFAMAVFSPQDKVKYEKLKLLNPLRDPSSSNSSSFTPSSQQPGKNPSPKLQKPTNFDDTILATGDKNGVISLWSIVTGKIIGELRGHVKDVRSLSFLPDGRLVSGGVDGTVRIWSISEKKQVGAFNGHKSSVYVVAASPDGKRIASGGGSDFDVRLWDVEMKEEPISLRVRYDSVYSLAFSPDGKYLAVGTDIVQIWDVARRVEVASIKAWKDAGGTRVAFTPDGHLFVAADTSGTIRVFNVQSLLKRNAKD